jgi:hypothetical protein
MDRAENCAIRARVRRPRLPQPFPGLILDVLGDVTLEDLTLAHLEDLRPTMRKRGFPRKPSAM